MKVLATGRKIPCRAVGWHSGDVPKLVASSARIRADPDWRPEIASLGLVIADAWEWHQTHPDGYPD